MLRLDLFKAILCFAVLRFCGVAARPQVNIGAFEKRAPTAVSELRTNAARMAAGFPPLPPRQLRDPTRVQARTQPSLVPHNGHIQVVSARDGRDVGWVKQSYGDPRFDTTTGWGNRISVSFSTSSSSSTPFNIAISGYGSFPYLGFAGSDIGGYSSTKNPLTRTAATPPGSVARPVGNGLSPGKPKSESAVWFYDSHTKQLTARWVNSGGSSVTSSFWYVPNHGLYLVGKTSGLGNGFEVKFYLN